MPDKLTNFLRIMSKKTAIFLVLALTVFYNGATVQAVNTTFKSSPTIDSGQQINFTDGGWINNNTFHSNGSVLNLSNSSNAIKLYGNNVGIGAINPSEIFQVSSTSIISFRVSDTQNNIRFQTSSGSNPTAAIGYSAGGNAGFLSGLVFSAYDGSSWKNNMYIDNGGNVGIGTTAPTNRLQVRSIAGGYSIASTTASGTNSATDWNNISQLKIDNSDSGGNALAFFVSGLANERAAFIQSGHTSGTYSNSLGKLSLNPFGGYVGIGTTTPGTQLDMTRDFRNSLATTHSALGGGGNLVVMADNTGTLYTSDVVNLWNGAKNGNIWNGNSGNVGIGTTAPWSKLTVLGATSQPSLTHQTAAVTSWTYGMSGAVDLSLFISNTAPYTASFQTRNSGADGATYPLALNPLGGNVGIGTTNPGALLDVYKASDSYIRIRDGAGASYGFQLEQNGTWANIWNFENGPMTFATNNSERMRITAAGNVGIGLTNPTYKLDVAGGLIRESGYLVGDAATDNLVANGDFELNTSSGWSTGTVVTGGYSGNYALQITGSNTLTSDDYIPVDPTKDIFQLDAWMKKSVAGATPGILYFGYIAYNANKAEITSAPCGTYCYFAAAGYNLPADGAWHKFSATTVGEGTSYPNFPVGTKYVRVLGLINYSGSSDAVTLIDHVTLKRLVKGPVIAGNNFSSTNLSDQNQYSTLYTTAGNNLIINSPGGIGIGITNPTGLFDVYAAASSTHALTIANSGGSVGYVGVGTNNPGTALDVDGSLRGLHGTTLSMLGGLGNAAIVMSDNNGGLYSVSTSTLFGFDNNNLWSGTKTGNIWNANSGNVGIGTTTPANNLVVSSANGTTLQVDGSGGIGTQPKILLSSRTNGYTASEINYDYYGSYASSTGSVGHGLNFVSGRTAPFSNFWFRNSSNNVGVAFTDPYYPSSNLGSLGNMNVLVGGSVGIGTTTPAEKLEIGSTGYPSLQFHAGSDAYPTIKSNSGDLYLDSGSGYVTVFGGSKDHTFSMWGSAAQKVQLSTNGNSYLNGGNVGIGNTAPSANLSVAGTTRINGDFIANGTGFYLSATSTHYTPANNIPTMMIRTDDSETGPENTLSGLVLYNSNGGQNTGANLTFASREAVGAGNDVALSGIFGWKTAAGVAGSWTSGGLRFWTKNGASVVDAMAINSLGNVGIGTTTPGTQLDITRDFRNSLATTHSALGGGGNQMVMTDNNGTLYAAPTTTSLLWAGSTNGNIWNANSGNVGVGTTNPKSKLSVASTSLGSIPALGTNGGQFSVLGDGAAYGMIQGVLTNGNVYQQVQRVDTGATAYNLLLQPNGGNVGIGTTNPGAKLDINYQGAFNTITPGRTIYGLHFSGQNTPDYATGITWNGGDSNGGNPVAQAGLYVQGSGNYGSKMYFATTQSYATGAQTRMMIDHVGNVGIGTTMPSFKFEVKGGTAPFGALKISSADNVSSAVYGGQVSTMYGYLGSGYYYNSSSWRTMNTAASNVIFYNDGALGFVTDSGLTADTNYAPTERMRISNSGNVGIGTTPSEIKLDVSNGFRALSATLLGFVNGGNQIVMTDNSGNLYAGGSAITGSGNANYVARWTASSALGTGALYDDGTNVGIGTATLTSKLTVNGSIAATGLSLTGALNMNNQNITGVNKLTVGAIDPLYSINGTKYSTYAASIVGGIREEYAGKISLNHKNPATGEYEATIDFANLTSGSDLWIWRKVVDFNKDNVEVSFAPYGRSAQAYYLINGNKLIFRADRRVEISYRLAGKRFDWRNWPTLATDQAEQGIEVK